MGVLAIIAIVLLVLFFAAVGLLMAKLGTYSTIETRKDNPDATFEVGVHRVFGPAWVWRVSRDGKAISLGLSPSKTKAQSIAAEVMDQYRQKEEAERVKEKGPRVTE